MWRFAWKNLLTRPLRTTLALVGLSIPILGVLGLYSVSGGLKNLVDDTLEKIQGVVVLRENAPSPVFSSVDPAYVDRIAAIPGVRAVAPEVWGIPPTVEGSSLMTRAVSGELGGLLSGEGDRERMERRMQTMFDAIVLSGQDIPSHMDLNTAVFANAMVPPGQGGGRFLDESDIGENHIVISAKIAENLASPDGTPKRVGDTLRIGSDPETADVFEIIGIYNTGSMFLDVVMITDIDVARRVLKEREDKISNIYVESDDPRRINEIAAAIEAELPDVDAREMDELASDFTRLLGDLDKFLLMIVSLALLVGVVGIVNTMLMSTTERFAEFGVLRTNGWSRGDVLLLVTAESAYLGLWAGLVGCGLSMILVAIGNQFVGGGLKLALGPGLMAFGLGLSVVMGVLGGLYPAWRASRLVPMDAIRLGAH
ncbi:ABC transporter permease [Tautonia plasticadhaerens]|uniref:Macrolide export ATP-binding/permease protein MacB n=1 Tax=Tautonia plasticadhaerens TaxID=2527974 RepID=A0A518GW64_9BACT|nr:ABC transporter permease [Tautonia plasticadhaerens]QDV32835.1 Macrolide export ATP-binding/permease protein MacB [Tautonia plasticadhaerens]